MSDGIRELSSPTWQPIETAPKDGSDVLVFNPMTGPYVSRFTDGEWPLHFWGFPGVWYPGVTHWMPLPPPPVGSGQNLADANSKSPIQAREE